MDFFQIFFAETKHPKFDCGMMIIKQNRAFVHQFDKKIIQIC